MEPGGITVAITMKRNIKEFGETSDYTTFNSIFHTQIEMRSKSFAFNPRDLVNIHR